MKKMRITLVLLMFMLVTFFAAEVLAATKTNMSTEITENFIRFSKNKDGCWFCALYKTIFCAGNAMVVAIFNALAQSCINLAAILMALWICWMVFKLFLGFSSDAAGFFANFFKALVIFVACVYTLDSRMGGGAKFIFDTFMNPLLETAADLSVSIMKAGTDGATGSVTTSLSASSNYNPAAAIQIDMGKEPFGVKVEDVPNATCPSSKQGGFSDKALQKLLQMIQAINLKVIQVMVAGKAMWTTGVNNDGSWGYNFDYMVSGIVLMLTGLYLLVVTMFKLVDAIIRLLFSCALLPLHVMFWIFPVTRRYTIAALQMFITSLCFFIVTATLLTFAIALLKGDKITEALRPLYNKDSYAELVKNFSISNGGFLVTVATSIIACGLMDLADPLASSFGGASSGGGPGAALRGAAGKAVGGAANLAGGVAKKGASLLGTAGVKVFGAGYKKIKKTVVKRTGKGAGGAKSYGGDKKDA